MAKKEESYVWHGNLVCLAGISLHIQADKLTMYSNWAVLQVSGSKTKSQESYTGLPKLKCGGKT